MEPKKISFGFSKTNKKPNFLTNKDSQKTGNAIELIKCLEGHEIKLVEEKKEEAPLVIPLKETQKTSTALASLIKRRAVLLGEDEPITEVETASSTALEDAASNETEDIEKRAAKELLAELNTNGSLNADSSLVLPVVHPNDLPLEGAKESSMDDYESIPIQDFGKAMLRGMGWVEPPKPTKGGPPVEDMPTVRPKGMGLGADKALKAKPLLVAPESNEVLEIKRKAYVRVLGGKHKDLYGQIEGFDDHAGRVIVKMAIGGAKEAFNEFLCQPISRKEYAQYGKCINTNKYEEYKRKENEFGQIILKKEEIDKIEKDSENKSKIKIEENHRNSKQCENKNIKDEVQEISSEEDKKPYEKSKDVKSSSSRESRVDHNRDKNRNEDRGASRKQYDRDEYKRSQRDYKDDDGKSEYEERKRIGNNYEREQKDNSKHAYENKRRDDRHAREKSRDRNDKCEDNKTSGSRSYGREKESTSQRKVYDKDYDKQHRKDYDEKQQRKDYYDKKQCSENASSDESEDNERSKHKKSNKNKKSKKKSKSSKKSKSKYSDSSDSESSSSSSDSEEEKRKKHKKKTKKSKRQRERSRSRGRR